MVVLKIVLSSLYILVGRVLIILYYYSRENREKRKRKLEKNSLQISDLTHVCNLVCAALTRPFRNQYTTYS